jgi:hypothetical protein
MHKILPAIVLVAVIVFAPAAMALRSSTIDDGANVSSSPKLASVKHKKNYA